MKERTWIHAFTDGRDVSPTSAGSDLAELPGPRLATVVGRYYAMDRDQRWERTQKALDAITLGAGVVSRDVLSTVHRSYEAGITDEFLEPVVVDGAPRLAPAMRRSSSTSARTVAASWRRSSSRRATT